MYLLLQAACILPIQSEEHPRESLPVSQCLQSHAHSIPLNEKVSLSSKFSSLSKLSELLELIASSSVRVHSSVQRLSTVQNTPQPVLTSEEQLRTSSFATSRVSSKTVNSEWLNSGSLSLLKSAFTEMCAVSKGFALLVTMVNKQTSNTLTASTDLNESARSH
jgi:hypothetical protein